MICGCGLPTPTLSLGGRRGDRVRRADCRCLPSRTGRRAPRPSMGSKRRDDRSTSKEDEMLPDYAEFDQAIGLDWYSMDPNLRFLLDRLLPDPGDRAYAEDVVGDYGALVGQRVAARAEVTDRHGPVLERYDAWGQDVGALVH